MGNGAGRLAGMSGDRRLSKRSPTLGLSSRVCVDSLGAGGGGRGGGRGGATLSSVGRVDFVPVYHSGRFHHLIFWNVFSLCEIQKLFVTILMPNSSIMKRNIFKCILIIFAQYLSKYQTCVEWLPSNFRSF